MSSAACCVLHVFGCVARRCKLHRGVIVPSGCCTVQPADGVTIINANMTVAGNTLVAIAPFAAGHVLPVCCRTQHATDNMRQTACAACKAGNNRCNLTFNLRRIQRLGTVHDAACNTQRACAGAVRRFRANRLPGVRRAFAKRAGHSATHRQAAAGQQRTALSHTQCSMRHPPCGSMRRTSRQRTACSVPRRSVLVCVLASARGRRLRPWCEANPESV